LRLEVGCSLGRGAADSLSDADAALGVAAAPGAAGAPGAAEATAAEALQELGPLVDGTQLDLALVADAEIQARHDSEGAPDFVALYRDQGAPFRRRTGRMAGPTPTRSPASRSGSTSGPCGRPPSSGDQPMANPVAATTPVPTVAVT
jgi:hypothetical protein